MARTTQRNKWAEFPLHWECKTELGHARAFKTPNDKGRYEYEVRLQGNANLITGDCRHEYRTKIEAGTLLRGSYSNQHIPGQRTPKIYKQLDRARIIETKLNTIKEALEVAFRTCTDEQYSRFLDLYNQLKE